MDTDTVHGAETRQWFATQVVAGREHRCAAHLRVRGYEVFLPCYSEHRRWSDRIKKVERALFAGYVFCRFGVDVLAKIVTTPGVIRIVDDGERPLSVPTNEIETIRRIVETGLTVEPWRCLRTGQRVRVIAGPLRDVEGIVLKVKNRHRLIVSVSVLSRAVAVEIDADWVGVSPQDMLAGAPGPVN